MLSDLITGRWMYRKLYIINQRPSTNEVMKSLNYETYRLWYPSVCPTDDHFVLVKVDDKNKSYACTLLSLVFKLLASN